MQTAHFRHIFPLSRPQAVVFWLLCAILLTLANKSLAQRTRQIHLEDYDRRKLHYGFQLSGFNAFHLLKHAELFASDTQDSVLFVNSVNSGGFALGLIVNLALKDEFWDIRIAPNFSFYNHQIAFKYFKSDPQKPVLKTNTIETTMFEIPILLMYKSTRRMNSRMYMLGGITPSFQLGGKKDDTEQKTIHLRRKNLEITYGIGFHFYMKMFNLAPELRFSHGLLNLLKKTDSPYSTNIEKLNTHKISLFLNFEG